MTVPTPALERALEELRDRRADAEHLEQCVRDSRAFFEVTISTEVERATFARALVTALEADVKSLALAAYEASGKTNKRPAKGVEIKVFQVCDYDPVVALHWALNHRVCLSLDAKRFERMAANETALVDLVEFRDDPRVQIATDLGKVLEGLEGRTP